MPYGKTLSRLASVSRNMLINPFFEAIDVPTNVANLNQPFLPTPDENVFRAAPGWFRYGCHEYGTITRPKSYVYAGVDNPFQNGGSVSQLGWGILGERVQPTPTDSSDQVFSNGVQITQKQGTDNGLVQPILRGGVLQRTRRVRLTGCYQILQNNGAGGMGTGAAGIHIFLKKDLKKMSLSTVSEDTGSALTRIDVNTVEDLTQNFLTTVAVGDTLVIDGIGYHRVTSVISDTQLDVEPNTTAWGGSKNYNILRPTSTVARLSEAQRVVLPADARFVAHLSAADPDFTHTNGLHSLTGQEHLIRAWDHLSSGPAGTLAEYKHLVLGPSTALPGQAKGFRNTSLSGANFHLYYLNNSIETNGDDGTVLYSEDVSVGGTVTPSTALRYFDEVVELDATTASDNLGEYFLVVVPVKPSLNGSIVTDVTIAIWGLTLSVVDDLEEGESVIISEFASAHRNSPMDSSGFPAKYLSAYPIYHPAVYPFRVRFQQAKAGNTGVVAMRIAAGSPMSSAPPVYSFSTNPAIAGGEFYLADQAPLPPGACLLGGGLPVYDKQGTWSTNLTLQVVECFAPPPYDTANRVGNPTYLGTNESLGRVVAELLLSDATVAQTVYKWTTVNRHRIGLWDGGAATETFIDLNETEYSRLGSSSIYVYMSTPAHNGPGSSIIQIRDGWFYVVYDPRWGLSSTHWD